MCLFICICTETCTHVYVMLKETVTVIYLFLYTVTPLNFFSKIRQIVLDTGVGVVEVTIPLYPGFPNFTVVV